MQVKLVCTKPPPAAEITFRGNKIVYPSTGDPPEDWGSYAVAETLGQLTYLHRQLPDIRASERRNFAIFTNPDAARKWTKPYSIDSVIGVVRETIGKLKESLSGYEGTNEQYYRKETRNDNVLFLGDFHGSFHSFVRILTTWYREEIVNDNLILRDGYMLVFTGDFVDRCFLSLELLLIICVLYNKNPDKVRICSGNHEAYNSLWYKYGFFNELQNDVGSENVDIFKTLVSYFYSAYFMRRSSTDKWIQFSHGVFDLHYEFHLQQVIRWLSDIPPVLALRKLTLHLTDEGKVSDSGNGYQWTDVTSIENSGARDDLISICANTSKKDRPQLDHKDIQKYIGDANIQVIIRGHQDEVNCTLIPNTNFIIPFGTFGPPNSKDAIVARYVPADKGLALPILYELKDTELADWDTVKGKLDEWLSDTKLELTGKLNEAFVMREGKSRWKKLSIHKEGTVTMTMTVGDDDTISSNWFSTDLKFSPVITLSSSLECRTACNMDTYGIIHATISSAYPHENPAKKRRTKFKYIVRL